MYFEFREGLSRLPQAYDGTGENTIGIVSFAELAGCSALHGITAAQLHPLKNIHFSRVELYPDMVLGTLAVPGKGGAERMSHVSAFCIRGSRIVFIDDTPFTEHVLERIMKAFVWHKPALSAFFCAYLDTLIEDDLKFMEALETQLSAIEDEVLHGEPREFEKRMSLLRHKTLALRRYYSQLAELAANLCESSLFSAEDKAALSRFISRCGHLESEAQMLREYALQVRESYQAQIELKQNKIMQVLTVVATICMPLTLITGWFGMNFLGMHELSWPYSYPAVIVLSVIVVLLCIWLCKKKKLL